MSSKKEGQGARKQKKIKKEEEHVGTEKQEEESSIDKLFVSEHDKTAWEEYLRKKKDRKEKKKKKKRKRTKRMKIREGESMPQDRVVVYSNHGYCTHACLCL